MNGIQNSYTRAFIPSKKTSVIFACVLPITAFAVALIKLMSVSTGPLNVITKFGAKNNEAMLGTSIFVLIWGLVTIASISKSKKNLPIERRFDPVSYLPNEVSLIVFSFLNAHELGRNCLVSVAWNRLATNQTLWNALDLRKISPLLKVLDEFDWSTHFDLSSFGVKVDDASPLDKRRAIPLLIKSLSSLQVENNLGVTLLTIPKGLTFNKLIQMKSSLQIENAVLFRYVWPRISEKIGKIAVEKTYRVMITNNILSESRRLSLAQQKKLVRKVGCTMPKVLEVVTLIVLTNMIYKQRLYNDHLWTYTRCSKQIDGYPLIVGGFSLPGLFIGHFNRLDMEKCGAAAVLQISLKAENKT